MPCRSLTTVALALVLSSSIGCASLNRNQKTGFAVIGGAAIVVGGTVIADGMTCDDISFNSTCEHDSGELTTGGITVLAGAALLTWAVLSLTSPAKAHK